MIRAGSPLRFCALLAAGAAALHELRYAVGYGHDAPEALASQGHGYLAVLHMALGVLVAVAVGVFVGALLRARPAGSAPRTPSLRRTWAAASVALLTIYVLQESLESALAPGHPVGLAGVFGHGGWAAIPLAMAVGAVVALVQRWAGAAIAAAAARRPARAQLRPHRKLPRPAVAELAARDAVARHLAGRGPPLSSI